MSVSSRFAALFLLGLMLLPPSVGWCDDPAPEPVDAGDEPRFETYWIVILERGEKAGEIDEQRLAEIQRGHLEHLTRLEEAGEILVAGPFEVGPDESPRGIVIYPGATDEARVRELVGADPAIRAGRLQARVLKWWVPGGRVRLGHAPDGAPAEAK